MRKIKTYIILLLSCLLLLVGMSMPSYRHGSPTLPFEVISSRTISLNKRYSNKYVNDVFKDNILLTLQYMNGKSQSKTIDWNTIEKPTEFEITLQPDEVFAFHDAVLPEYQGKVVKTTRAHFNGIEGFKSDGYLMGDGVCHLASLMNWVAQDAGLDVTARVSHDFAHIPEVPREYGTSIMTPDAMQNLYIKNNFKKQVVLKFNYDGANLTVAVTKASEFIAKH